jgi:hypothetical protein
MHQQSRHPPRVSSPASSPQTNPARTNNQRDRGRAGLETAAEDGAPGGSDGYDAAGTGPSRESIKKLDQIIQVRQALLIHTPQGTRANGSLPEFLLQSCSTYPTITP